MQIVPTRNVDWIHTAMKILPNHHRAITSPLHPYPKMLLLIPQLLKLLVGSRITIIHRARSDVRLDSRSMSVLPSQKARPGRAAQRRDHMAVGEPQTIACQLTNVWQITR